MGALCCGTSLTVPARIGAAEIVTVGGPAPIPPEHARMFAPVRARLWELPDTLHCSVVGTCLSTAALHKLLSRLGLVRQADTEHQLHGRAVALAGQQTAGARLLHKLLDTTHATALRAFGRAGTEAALRVLWSDALERGDIPGPYWAVLTHPCCSYALRQDAFGRVHMLSHLVGAANRADLRRLAELETANAGLRAKIDRQQARLQQQAADTEATLRTLRDALSRQAAATVPGPVVADAQALRDLVADLRRRLDVSEHRVEALDARLADAQAALVLAAERQAAAEQRAEAATTELAAAEAALSGATARDGEGPALAGLSVLYVGGRPQGAAAMHGLAARLGAVFMHHDGGTESHAGLLPGLVGRADVVMFPVDCISHEAALAIKRLCRNGGKLFLPLRSSGLGSFLAALRTVQAGQQTAA